MLAMYAMNYSSEIVDTEEKLCCNMEALPASVWECIAKEIMVSDWLVPLCPDLDTGTASLREPNLPTTSSFTATLLLMFNASPSKLFTLFLLICDGQLP